MGLFGPPNIEKLKAKKDVPGLIKALGYRKDYWNESFKFDKEWREDILRVASVRVAAAKALGEIGDPRAVTPLIDALDDKVFEVNAAAGEALGKIGKPAVEPLHMLLREKKGMDCKAVVGALGLIDDPSTVDILLSALEQQDGWIKEYIIKALGMKDNPRIVEALISTLHDDGWGTAISAIRVLGHLGDKRAIEPLRPLLHHKKEPFRRAASEALEKLGWQPDQLEEKVAYWLGKGDADRCAQLGPKAVSLLINSLKHEDQTQTAAVALGQIGDQRAVKPLLSVLQSKVYNSRMAAVFAISQIGASSAVLPMIEAIKEEPRLKDAVVEALIQMGETAVPPLIKILETGQPWGFSALIRQVLISIGPSAVKPLTATLKHPNENIRQKAADILVDIGKPSIQPLTDLLLSTDRDVQQVAVTALDKLKWQPGKNSSGAAYYIHKKQWLQCAAVGKQAVEPLINALQDTDAVVRGKAAQILGQLEDPRAAAPLIATLGDQEGAVRIYAAEALGKIGDSRAVDPLIAALGDKDLYVRRLAAEALGQIGDICAVEPLIAALVDDERDVRCDAAQALGEINDTRAIEPLIFVLRDWSSAVRQSAADALEKLGWQPDESPEGVAYWIVKRAWDRCIQIGTPAVGPLIDALEDEDRDNRQSAALALGKIGDPRAIKPLINVLWGEMRPAAASALARIGTPAVEPLIAILAESSTQHLAAIEVLGRIGDPRAVEPIIPALESGNAYLTLAAADVLLKFKEGRAIEGLIPLLKDISFSIRQSAAKTLIRFYQADVLTEPQKNLLLKNRSLITAKHDDQQVNHFDSRGGSDCHHDASTHIDSGIGVPFPK